MDIFESITRCGFSLVLISENEYEKKLGDLVRTVEQKAKICYVCLSKPYTYMIEQLKSQGIDTEKFLFVDVLSSHYLRPKSVENCIFVESPSDLDKIKDVISKAISEKNCSCIIFDTISSLLIYEHNHDIIKFTHEINSFEQENINKVFIMLKDQSSIDSVENLIKDIRMFADKTIDLEDTRLDGGNL